MPAPPPDSGSASAGGADAAGGSPPFSLSGADSPFASFPITTAQLEGWSARYRKGARQIRRWIDDAPADDPCPINDPIRLVQWWARNRTWRVPDSLHAAAAAARAATPPPCAPTPDASTPATPEPAIAPLSPTIVDPIILADHELTEGEVVQQQRRIVAAVYRQLEDAYARGHGNIDLIQSKYVKAAEALRKLEKDDRADAATRGVLIPRATIQRDVDTACELLRQMSEHETRGLLELCPSLTQAARSEVISAMAALLQSRQRVLRNLRSLRTTADALLDLTAA